MPIKLNPVKFLGTRRGSHHAHIDYLLERTPDGWAWQAWHDSPLGKWKHTGRESTREMAEFELELKVADLFAFVSDLDKDRLAQLGNGGLDNARA